MDYSKTGMQLHALHRAFSDPLRLRILHLLSQRPLCVCHIQALLRQPQVRVSKHLATLRALGILQTTRRRNWSIYAIDSQPGSPLAALLEVLSEHGRCTPPFAQDLERLKELAPELGQFDALESATCTAPSKRLQAQP
jgi:ArsR family transcriptional regulator